MTLNLTPQLIGWIVLGVALLVLAGFTVHAFRRKLPDDCSQYSRYDWFICFYGFFSAIIYPIVAVALLIAQINALFQGKWFFWQ